MKEKKVNQVQFGFFLGREAKIKSDATLLSLMEAPVVCRSKSSSLMCSKRSLT